MLDKEIIRGLFVLRDWGLWVFLLCLASGVVSATDMQLARRTYIFLAISLASLFYIGKAMALSDKGKAIFITMVCLCSGFVVLFGLLEFIYAFNPIYVYLLENPYYDKYMNFLRQPMSTQLNPTILGSFVLGCLPFNLYLLKLNRVYAKVAAILLSVLSILIIFLTGSRGVLLGLIVLILFYLWKIKTKRMLAIFLVLMLLFLTYCSFSHQKTLRRFGFKRMVFSSDDSMLSEYRFTRLKMAYKVFKDYPLFGIGLHHFRIHFDKYYEGEKLWLEAYERKVPDNMYLTFLAETGVLGTCGFLLFIVPLLVRGIKKSSRSHITLIATSSLVGILVNMAAYEIFYWYNPYMLFCLICGFAQGDT